MNATEFLTALWGDQPPGLIALWTLGTKRSSYLLSANAATSLTAGKSDVYTGVATAHKDWGATRRVTAKTAAAIAGLWLDLDVDGGPTNKTGAAPTKATALLVARHLVEPTIIIDSGYGIHAWYLLDRPWRFINQEEQDAAALMSAQWYALHRFAALDDGWTIDGTHDLARLLRIPGTFNHKGGHHAPVEVIHAELGARPTRAELELMCAAAGAIDPGAHAWGTGVQGQLDLTITTTSFVDRTKLDAAIANTDDDPTGFAATWNHTRADTVGWSMSEWDMSLARQAALAGWTDQEIADLLREHRHRIDAGDAKGLRHDYIARTIRAARADHDADKAAALEQLRQLGRRAA